MGKKLTAEIFTQRSTEIFDGYYDYSLSIYVKTDVEVKIICPIHGIFKQTPHHHLQGHGCKLCANIIIDNKKKKWTKDSLVDNYNKFHNHKFDYSLMVFTTINDYIDIICPVHGKFRQKAQDHQTHGCADCAKELLKGSSNPNYIDGRSSNRGKERNYPEYRKWLKVIKEDQIYCDCCGVPFSEDFGKRAHHLNSWNAFPDERCDPSNGVCICELCHENFHSQYGWGGNTKEQYYQFKELGRLLYG